MSSVISAPPGRFRRFECPQFCFVPVQHRHCMLRGHSDKPHRSVLRLPHNRRCSTWNHLQGCNRMEGLRISLFYP